MTLKTRKQTMHLSIYLTSNNAKYQGYKNGKLMPKPFDNFDDALHAMKAEAKVYREQGWEVTEEYWITLGWKYEDHSHKIDV